MRVPRKTKKKLKVMNSPFQKQSKSTWHYYNDQFKNVKRNNAFWKQVFYYK
jgi:hypothetical protein